MCHILLFLGCQNIWFSKCVSVKVDLLVIDDLANLGGGTLLMDRGLDQIHVVAAGSEPSKMNTSK